MGTGRTGTGWWVAFSALIAAPASAQLIAPPIASQAFDEGVLERLESQIADNIEHAGVELLPTEQVVSELQFDNVDWYACGTLGCGLKAGKKLKASHLLLTTLQEKNGRWTIVIQLFDIARRKRLAKVSSEPTRTIEPRVVPPLVERALDAPGLPRTEAAAATNIEIWEGPLDTDEDLAAYIAALLRREVVCKIRVYCGFAIQQTLLEIDSMLAAKGAVRPTAAQVSQLEQKRQKLHTQASAINAPLPSLSAPAAGVSESDIDKKQREVLKLRNGVYGTYHNSGRAIADERKRLRALLREAERELYGLYRQQAEESRAREDAERYARMEKKSASGRPQDELSYLKYKLARTEWNLENRHEKIRIERRIKELERDIRQLNEARKASSEKKKDVKTRRDVYKDRKEVYTDPYKR